ncbi:MAG: rhomboid family intramembrane serine protease [Chitinophagales bacterium]|nr:rhomboid family intramembrane serine protease [Chitinophagales bacterium]
MKFRIGTTYKTEIAGNNISSEKFITAVTETIKKLEWDIKYLSKSGAIAYTPFSMKGNEEVTIRIDNDIVYIKSFTLGSQLHDWGKNEKVVNTFIEAYNNELNTLNSEDIDTHYANLVNVLDEDNILSAEKYADMEKNNGFLSLFIPRNNYFITPILIILNILVFIAMVVGGANFLSPDGETIFAWGGNYGPGTLNGQWWRLLTCVFVHIGFLHLAMNMYALMYIGLFLEPIMGRWKFLISYILTGITASLMSTYIHPDTVSAGASGAIFGLYGIFLAMLTTNLIDKATRKAILPSIAVFVGYNLLYGMKDNVDNAAHIGGLIGGAILGFAYYPSLKDIENKKLGIITTIAASIVVAALIPITLLSTHNSEEEYIGAAQRYQENIEKFSNMESMALEVLNISGNPSREDITHDIQSRGIYYWKECGKLLDENEKIAPNDKSRKINNVLKEYVALRQQSYELIYKKIQDSTDIYDNKIQDINNQIEASLSKLKTIE